MDDSCSTCWLLTSFYGELETSHRQRTWDLLRDIAPQQPCPLMVLGDFNEILVQTEKAGGKQCSEALMSNFRQLMEDCALSDLGHHGDFFNWSNKHYSSTFTKERLDRAVANPIWIGIKIVVRVESLVS